MVRGNESIKPSETPAPSSGTSGTQGVRNGRGTSGILRRRIHTPRHTMTKAERVPMLTSCASAEIGRNAAATATGIPTTIEEIQGVRNRGCTTLAQRGSRPSRDMVKKMRDCPSSITSITLESPATAPILTSRLPQRTPVASIPTATGSATFNCR